jgi:hypothetical protein
MGTKMEEAEEGNGWQDETGEQQRQAKDVCRMDAVDGKTTDGIDAIIATVRNEGDRPE